MTSYSTLSEAVGDLQRRGYTDDLKLLAHAVLCGDGVTELAPDEFHIDEFHRFEGDTDPADESIVYAISAPARGIRGILVNGFGPSASTLTQAMVARLATH
jgi:hypothetical protein